MDSELQDLIETHTNGLLDRMREAFLQPVRNFQNDLYPILADLDSRIPGIGMQYAIWSKTTPHYPFSEEFDSIVRPLRYVPYELASGGTPQLHARNIAICSGMHLESCVKEFCRVSDLHNLDYGRMPLGRLANQKLVRSLLEFPLADSLCTYSEMLNQAKHEYSGSSPASLISVEDALGRYFAARALGSEILVLGGRLEPLVQAMEETRRRQHIYVTGEIPRVPDAAKPWTVSGVSKPLVGNESHFMYVAPEESDFMTILENWNRNLVEWELEKKDSSEGPDNIRVIKMTARAPLRFNADEWAILAFADDDSRNGLQPGPRFHARQQGEADLYFLIVRQHADGRSLIYGQLKSAYPQFEQPAGGESFHAGYLVRKPSEIISAIERVGDECRLPAYLIRDCISRLPPEDLK